MTATDAELALLVRKLQARPGRGGIRLSYRQAQLALRLIGSGARALERDIRRRRAEQVGAAAPIGET